MNTPSTPFDLESFHELAGSIVVRENGVDMKSLSDLLDLQESIATGEFDLNRSIYLIAKRARTIANATGVAIALLQEDQLVYQVGCGSAAVYVGQRVMATLSTSQRNRADILRIENAQVDSPIATEMCRQFGANSLLMIPIYHEGMVEGVLQVFLVRNIRLVIPRWERIDCWPDCSRRRSGTQLILKRKECWWIRTSLNRQSGRF